METGQEEQIHITLANIKFKIAEGADLSSAATSIRIESSETAAGYNFYGQDLNLGEDINSEDFSRLIIQPLEDELRFNNTSGTISGSIF